MQVLNVYYLFPHRSWSNPTSHKKNQTKWWPSTGPWIYETVKGQVQTSYCKCYFTEKESNRERRQPWRHGCFVVITLRSLDCRFTVSNVTVPEVFSWQWLIVFALSFRSLSSDIFDSTKRLFSYMQFQVAYHFLVGGIRRGWFAFEETDSDGAHNEVDRDEWDLVWRKVLQNLPRLIHVGAIKFRLKKLLWAVRTTSK